MNLKNRIIEIWTGKYSFGRSFWIIFILNIHIIQLFAIFWLSGQNKFSVFEDLLSVFFSIFIATYYVFASVGTWRSATQYINLNKLKKLKKFWGVLAKFIILMITFKIIFQLYEML
jgi:hypothetical protein